MLITRITPPTDHLADFISGQLKAMGLTAAQYRRQRAKRYVSTWGRRAFVWDVPQEKLNRRVHMQASARVMMHALQFAPGA